MYGYIYLILNKVNGKTYVGKKKLYRRKWNEDNYMGSGILLKPAQKKYGIENFEKFLITYTESKEDACEKEKFWIAEYKSRCKAEYNISKGGDGGNGGANKGKTYNIGHPVSEETRKKLSESGKGKHFGSMAEETKIKIAETMKGRTFSEEHKKHLSEAGKGKKMSEEARRKMSKSKKDKHWKVLNGKRVWY